MTEKLDSVENIKKLDPEGMYDKIFNFPEQLESAAKIGIEIKPDLKYFKDINSIIVTGMGGSAIGGDLVRSLLAGEIKIPITICRNYHLPNFVDENCLVIGSSYSGNTEETLSAINEAIGKNAKIACITTGGKLGEIADKNSYLKVSLPTGYPPRAALGFSFVPLMYLLGKIGLASNVDKSISELIKGLRVYRQNYAKDTPTENNPAKKLALKLFGKIPVIYTGPELTDTVGIRWKGQICENAKCLAFHNQFPEFNHNELVGWEIIAPYKNNVMVVMLHDSDDHDQVSKRMTIVKEIIEKNGVEAVDIYSQGDFPLGRMFSLIQMGDFASFYLAILNEVDPTPVKVIDYLKEKLEK